jgi:hypothetical protein
MKDVPADVNVKAMVAAIVVYAVGMGVAGDYWAVKCGPHWFMYIVSFSLFAVPVLLVVYAIVMALLVRYPAGRLRYWLLVGAFGCAFFAGCFVFAHLQPATPFYSGDDCVPF